MKKRILYFVVSLAIVILFCGFQSNTDVLRIGNIYYSSNNVQIYFTDPTHVVDSTDPFVTIDSSPLQNVRFEQLGKNNDYPVTILFLVDLKKNNYFLERERAKQIIERFMDINDLGEARQRTYFVMPFGERVESAYNPQVNPKTLEHNADRSDYFAALSEGINFLVKRRNDNIREFQAIVLITDGSEHTENAISKLNLKNELKDYGIPVFAVVHNDQENITPEDNVKLVREITDASNGTTQRAREYKDDNKTVVEKIIVEILRSYVLTGTLQSDYTGLNVNSEDAYQLTLRFGTRGSETASAIKQNAKIRGLYEDVIGIWMEQTAVAQAATAEWEASETAIAQTSTAEWEASATAIAQTENAGSGLSQNDFMDWLLNRSTPIFGYPIANIALVGFAVALIVTALVVGILRSRKDETEKSKDLDWDRDEDDFRPPLADSVPDEIPTAGFGVNADRAKLSCNISFENMDRNRAEAPIRESIISGEEKTFGRRTAEGVVGLNGDESISKVHFKLAFVNGTLYIEDMASSNGVVLNGNRIQTRARLKDKDILLIGKTTYRVHVINSNFSVDSDDKTQLYF